MLRTVIENTSSSKIHKLSPVNTVAMALIGALTTAAFGIYVAYIAYLLNDGFVQSDLEQHGFEVGLAYDALYLVTIIFAAFLGLIVLIKERSKATVLMALLVIPTLFLRKVLDLAYDAAFFNTDTNYYKEFTKTLLDLNWADMYIYIISVIVIGLGLAIIACLHPRESIYNSQRQKHLGYDNNTQVENYN